MNSKPVMTKPVPYAIEIAIQVVLAGAIGLTASLLLAAATLWLAA